MPDDFVDVSVTSPMGGEPKKYRIKYARWVADMIAEKESRDAHGEVDTLALWIKRLTRDIADPDTGSPLSEEQIRKMPRWELNFLIVAWLRVNEVPAEAFLPALLRERKTDSSIS